MDSNFQYASTVTLVCAPTSSSIIWSPSPRAEHIVAAPQIPNPQVTPKVR